KSARPFVVRLRSYEIGHWRCQCGMCTGHGQRFDHSCACGLVSGQGMLGPKPPICANCGLPTKYRLCPSCSTRVNLDLLWRLREGPVHPCAFTLPVSAELLLEGGEKNQSVILDLLSVPMLLGLHERDNDLIFDMPDFFWLDRVGWTGEFRHQVKGNLVALE